MLGGDDLAKSQIIALRCQEHDRIKSNHELVSGLFVCARDLRTNVCREGNRSPLRQQIFRDVVE